MNTFLKTKKKKTIAVYGHRWQFNGINFECLKKNFCQRTFVKLQFWIKN